jgi:lipopolysaccharide export system permease protein
MLPSHLNRKVAREIMAMFLVSLTVLTVLLMFIGVAREALRQGLQIDDVIRLIPYAVPNALAISFPGTVLFSMCCVFGRMSSSNEFTALKSVGISPLSVMMPAIILAFIFSVITVGLVNVAFTWGNRGMQQVMVSSIEKVAYGMLDRDRNFQHGPLSVTVMDVEGDRLIRPTIIVRQHDKPPINISAQEATLKFSSETNGLTLCLKNGTADLGDRASFRFPDTFVHTVPLRAVESQDLLTANPSQMAMSDLTPAAIKQSSDIHQRQGTIAVHTGFHLLTSRTELTVDEDAVEREAMLQGSRARLHRLNTEKHRRWASGFTCLALAMVGIPLAIQLKTSDVMTTFGICFLPTLLVYYPIFALTLDMAKQGKLPPNAVWLANYLFFCIGVLMIRRVMHS